MDFYETITIDDLVKSLKIPFSVIPAKAGIQYFQRLINTLDSGACPGPDPGFTGVTTFYGIININLKLLQLPFQL